MSNTASKRVGDPQFLREIRIARYDNFKDVDISFESSVVGFVGPNGAGKSSLLKLAEMPYRQFSQHGAALNRKWNQSVQVDFEIVDLEQAADDGKDNCSTTTASFSEGEWNQAHFDRSVYIFDLTRYAADRTSRFPGSIDRRALGAVASILGLDIAEVSGATTVRGGAIAQLTSLFGSIYGAPAHSLFLLDDIETGLQGFRVRRLIEELIFASEEKSVQIIFAARSLDAIAPLPTSAVWTVVNGGILHGKPDGTMLDLLGGGLNADLAVFVESAFMGEIAWAVFRTYSKFIRPLQLSRIVVCAIHNRRTVNSASKYVNENAKNLSALSFLAESSEEPSVIHFPGIGDPSYFIIDTVMSLFPNSLPTLTGMMQQRPDDQDAVESAVIACRKRNIQSDQIFKEIGEVVHGTTDPRVQRAFTMTWAQMHLDLLRAMLEPVIKTIPVVQDAASTAN